MSLLARWIGGDGFKPRDVEEPIDFYWHRPLAARLVRVLVPLPITPNQVTVASGLMGALSGVALSLGAWVAPWWSVLGAVLLLLSIVFDCADGQLARVRGTSSEIGRALDGTMDSVAPLFVFHGLAFTLLARGYSFFHIWPIGAVTAASLIWHASEYDVSKNIYLHASRPDFSLGGSTLLSVESMRASKRAFEQKGERLNAFLMGVWAFWTKPQVKAMAPWLEDVRMPNNDGERAVYREVFRPQMRVLSWLGFGSHLFLLTMCGAAAAVDARGIWLAWFVIVVPMNIACLWVTTTRKGRVARFEQRLAALRSGTAAP